MAAAISRILVPLAMLPGLALAQDFTGYKVKALDAVIDEWNARTKNDGPGVSFSAPEKVRFVVTMKNRPAPCSTGPLEAVSRLMDFTALLEQVKISHCIMLASRGRAVLAYVQDVLVPGLNSDVSIGDPMEVYADILAFQVNADRSRNTPIMLVNRFEPMRH
jgi:hypothetical protein